ncbi:putative dynein, axonemal, heavy polypeptide 1, partial [Operophtera brumata]
QFPFETFVPKLQFLSVVLPKELPRLVKIERLRRKFLAANIKGEQYPCPGLAFIPKGEGKPSKGGSGDFIQTLNNLYEWTNVAAFSFDKSTETWEVMALDGSKRRFNIPRIRLMFKADDPETFAQRVRFACDLRREIENNL